MLVRFVVSNYLSFGEETEFNMLTGSPRRFKEHVYKTNGIELLKTAAIYGPNGAGKSNLVRGIVLLKELVEKDASINEYRFEAFKLSNKYSQSPIKFEIEFVNEGHMYSYGLSVFQGKIKEEFLYRIKGKKESLVFLRQEKNGKTNIDVGNNFNENEEDKLRIKLYEEELLPNDKLLLCMFAKAKRTYTDVKKAYEWITDKLIVIDTDSVAHWFPIQYFFMPEFGAYSNELFKSLKTGVSKLEIRTMDIERYFGEDDKEESEAIKRKLTKEKEYLPIREHDANHYAFAVIENEKAVIKRLVALHQNDDHEYSEFEISDESDGTQRILDFIPGFFDIMVSDSTLIIDEIDQSIHPYLLKEFIAKFVNNHNTKGQLIFTTHDSNLLDQSMFRQDEIWFAEKTKYGQTRMYPLSDYDIRHDLDIRKGYLNGRFGAIPFLGNLKDLNWEKYATEKPTI